MKRQTFVTSATMGGERREAKAYAWNSCLKAGEGLVREWARELGRMFELHKSERVGNVYDAVWYSGDLEILVHQYVLTEEGDQ